MLRKILDRVGFEHQVGTYPYENDRSTPPPTVRHWSIDHRVVQAEGSSPGGVFTNFFSAMIFISVLSGLMDFSDIVILCSRPKLIVVANKTLSVLICL